MVWFLGLYLYVCILFGIWYVRWRKALPGPSEFKSRQHHDGDTVGFFFTIFATWWYWPLMVLYVVQDHLEKEAKKIEEYKNKHNK